MRFFVSRGYAVKGSAAIVGNLSQESTVNLHSGFTVRTDHGSQGIAQWRLERLTGLHQFCDQKGLDVQNLGSQLLYLEWELKNLPRHGLQWLDAMLIKPAERSIANLTANFSTYFESPSKQYENLDFRIAQADKCVAAYVPAKPSTVPIVVTGGAAGGIVGSVPIAMSQGLTGPLLAALVTLAVAAVVVFLLSIWMKKSPATPVEATGVHGMTLTALDELRNAMEEFKAVSGKVDAAEAVVLMHRNESDTLLEELKSLRNK